MVNSLTLLFLAYEVCLVLVILNYTKCHTVDHLILGSCCLINKGLISKCLLNSVRGSAWYRVGQLMDLDYYQVS